MNSSQCQDARHETPHQLPCDCCAEHCDPQEWVEIEEDQAMNTQDDSISRDELVEPAKKVVEITRAALVDKLVDRRMDDFDSHDLDDAVRNGRYGYAELPNAELEDLADEWGLEEDGVEVRYKITDADAKPMPEDINAELLKQLKHANRALYDLAPERYDDDEHKANWERLLEDISNAIAKAEGK